MHGALRVARGRRLRGSLMAGRRTVRRWLSRQRRTPRQPSLNTLLTGPCTCPRRPHRTTPASVVMSLEAACKPSSVPEPIRIGPMDGHPSVRPTRELSEPPAAARRPPCAPLFGLAPARACPFHSRFRRSGHRHCGAGPRLTADGCYPLACSMELGLSSNAAFRRSRPRPSGRLQEGPSSPMPPVRRSRRY